MENATLIVLVLMAIAAIVVAIRNHRKKRAAELAEPRYRRTPHETLIMPGGDPGVDQMNPHGDGTLRPGDPMFEIFQKTMEGDGNAVIGNRRADGDFDVEVYPLEDGRKEEER